MANCIRVGVPYKRHQFKDGRCKKCGQVQIQKKARAGK